ncbi:hypothetical protein NL676_014396 [Syzygium grande]|nr:hypothetical protein NL676_014396 [Syzygium grande]
MTQASFGAGFWRISRLDIPLSRHRRSSFLVQHSSWISRSQTHGSDVAQLEGRIEIATQFGPGFSTPNRSSLPTALLVLVVGWVCLNCGDRSLVRSGVGLLEPG